MEKEIINNYFDARKEMKKKRVDKFAEFRNRIKEINSIRDFSYCSSISCTVYDLIDAWENVRMHRRDEKIRRDRNRNG